jgi:hypothetical protein
MRVIGGGPRIRLAIILYSTIRFRSRFCSTAPILAALILRVPRHVRWGPDCHAGQGWFVRTLTNERTCLGRTITVAVSSRR